jgi:hypothetical protein
LEASPYISVSNILVSALSRLVNLQECDSRGTKLKEIVEVGLLARGVFRNFLAREKFKSSEKFEWEESKGLLSSTFLINAPKETLKLIWDISKQQNSKSA